ncbi:hypothetical protein GJAV_G00051930 [Gymnothorax javanicus]|nr:hypothetical protein GJAV_G00051930 [Gymnothorax javanicus]
MRFILPRAKGDNDGKNGSSSTFPTFPPFRSTVGPVGIGVAVALCLIVVLILYCLLRRSCKSKCCKRPSRTQRVLQKMGLKKKKGPFTISGMLDRK